MRFCFSHPDSLPVAGELELHYIAWLAFRIEPTLRTFLVCCHEMAGHVGTLVGLGNYSCGNETQQGVLSLRVAYIRCRCPVDAMTS